MVKHNVLLEKIVLTDDQIKKEINNILIRYREFLLVKKLVVVSSSCK